jgi:hypothetical protein
MATATSSSADSVDTSPAYVEFSQLESWLASSSALQLPLRQIESQQQAKGREVQRLLLPTHWLHRGHGDVGPALQLYRQDGEVLLFSSPAGRPLPYLPPSLEPWNWFGWAVPAREPPASFRSTRRWPCLLVLLRTPAAPGQGRRAESFSGIGSNHCRVDRRCRLQRQFGRDPTACRAGF